MTNKNRPKTIIDLCTNTENWVVMENNLLKGQSSLSALQAKLLRIVIMQIKIDDANMSAYHIKARDLAKILQLNVTHYSRDLKKVCCDLAEKKVKIETHNPKNPWKVIPWIGYIEYTDNAEIIIALNVWLSPYLISLKKFGNYTQYVLEFILSMNSIFAIRIYELLKMMLPNDLPTGGLTISLPNDKIRRATDTETVFPKNSDFKRKILEVAMREINEKTDLKITFEQKKCHGRSYDTTIFTCKSRWDTETLPITMQCRVRFVKINQLR